jgi:hypothetical protein
LDLFVISAQLRPFSSKGEEKRVRGELKEYLALMISIVSALCKFFG